MNWLECFPNKNEAPSMLDIGCGWGGLVRTVSELYPQYNVLGMEIRDTAVEYGHQEINKDREKGKTWNGWVIECNCMKYLTNYIQKGQLLKIFITFPDPHFKNSMKRRRIINEHFAAEYVYCLKPGEGMLYTASDVKELFEWNTNCLDKQTLLERLPSDYSDDCVVAVMTKTEEAKKVEREKRDKWCAVYKRQFSKRH